MAAHQTVPDRSPVQQAVQQTSLSTVQRSATTQDSSPSVQTPPAHHIPAPSPVQPQKSPTVQLKLPEPSMVKPSHQPLIQKDQKLPLACHTQSQSILQQQPLSLSQQPVMAQGHIIKPIQKLTSLGKPEIKVGPIIHQRPGEPTTLIDPVTGLLIPMREGEEGQYIPVGGSDTEHPPEKRLRLDEGITKAPVAAIRPSVVRPPQPPHLIPKTSSPPQLPHQVIYFSLYD